MFFQYHPENQRLMEFRNDIDKQSLALLSSALPLFADAVMNLNCMIFSQHDKGWASTRTKSTAIHDFSKP